MSVVVMLGKSLSLIRYQGPRWLAFRALYAAKRRTGWFRRELPCDEWASEPNGSLAHLSLLPDDGRGADLGSIEAVRKADDILADSLPWFSHHAIQARFPPDWFFNPWGNGAAEPDMRHWSEIGDFAAGDIKGLWEQARFGFVFQLVRAHAHSGDDRYPEAFWQAVEDFRAGNRPQCGPHWKCGQEIALRLMAWAFGFMNLFDSTATTPKRETVLAEMIEVSARRIEANISYALSQRNNHGVSEAAGLFTAGILLDRKRWIKAGQRLLDRLAQELIYDDGSFSQHSTNYHRLMLHDYVWCIRLSEVAGQCFSDETVRRVRQAGRWLLSMIALQTGNVPNLGPNDGTHFLDLTDLGYTDYRPTVQALGLAVDKRCWLPAVPWDELAAWMGLVPPHPGCCAGIQLSADSTAAGVLADAGSWSPNRKAPTPNPSPEDGGGGQEGRSVEDAGEARVRVAGASSRRSVAGSPSHVGCDPAAPRLTAFRDGGYVVWRDDSTLALLRCAPRFRHRPPQCDLLHFDLWFRGRNVLRDAGTYSYNCEQPWLSYFSSSKAHNTIRFDDRDPMPKLSRFLYGAWPRGELELEGERATTRYRDYQGARHSRLVYPTPGGFRVEDLIGGRFRTAVLRWRLDPGLDWTLTENGCRSAELELAVRTPARSAIFDRRICAGWESLYYWQKNELPVLEIEVNAECRKLVTEISFNCH